MVGTAEEEERIEAEQIVTREGLERYFDQLIAGTENVRPEDVTEDYIRGERERRIYPHMRFDIDSGYGGYTTTNLEVLSRNEIDDAVGGMERGISELIK